MTVLSNGIESLELKSRSPDIKQAIKFNNKVEEKLHVVIMCSNPCAYKRRWQLAKEFMERMEQNDDVTLHVVELAYGDQEYMITDASNPSHLQLRTTTPLWHKENCINLGIQKLLPSDWKCVAWIDADVEFESASWASDTLKILNGSKDVVQLFSHCMDMARDETTMQMFHGFGYNLANNRKYCGSGVNFWHPGYAWACTRKAYEVMGGLYSCSILGSGDHQMSQAFIGNHSSIHTSASDAYKQTVKQFTLRASSFRVGYVPGVIRHFFHGSKANRKYHERWNVLVNNQYDPKKHMELDDMGVIVPTPECPPKLIQDILQYFYERKEDD
jgi:hypothetical protein